jgi:hypothetical protein
MTSQEHIYTILLQSSSEWLEAFTGVYNKLVKSYQEQLKAKDLAYSERNKLVSLLSKLFPASLERHPEEDKTWEDDWRWIVFIQLPTGQVSWHIHDSELPLFDHLPREQGVKWDGHTNDEKWDRVSKFIAKDECQKSPETKKTYLVGGGVIPKSIAGWSFEEAPEALQKPSTNGGRNADN